MMEARTLNEVIMIMIMTLQLLLQLLLLLLLLLRWKWRWDHECRHSECGIFITRLYTVYTLTHTHTHIYAHDKWSKMVKIFFQNCYQIKKRERNREGLLERQPHDMTWHDMAWHDMTCPIPFHSSPHSAERASTSLTARSAMPRWERFFAADDTACNESYTVTNIQ